MTRDDEGDREVAAALVVAIEAGLLSFPDAVGIVDRELVARPSPGGWLIEASLAKTRHDLLRALQTKADGHPMLSDTFLFVAALEKAVASGASVLDVGQRITWIYPYGEWPSELAKPLYDVYEEATCAHEHGGVPHAESVERALRMLFGEVQTKSSWLQALENVVQ